ncbi:tRNA-2-methylthio-N6-dimethylallyladenosine synthase [Elusimicrobium posterum]|uniref:tRNA (N6-isopentenyl adenosine(37)-C2)-methylthiotransferase MiaB n=1 Tax=Elusimicrobium posterum TaxID=3116653 RepID=UPI003C707F28
MKVFVQTFGCQMNVADSSEMMGHLSAYGAVQTEEMKEADVVLVNTCTIREHAEHRALSFLGRLAKWKEEDALRVVIFAGCAAQRLGEKLKKDYPFLDIVAGAKGIDAFAKTLKDSGVFEGYETQSNTDISVHKNPVVDFVTIMRGCNFKCSYCIVPSVRGGVICLEPEVILQRTKELVAKGIKEVVLLGQTVNAYKYGDIDFTDLLDMVSRVEGVERVRFMSPHPSFINERFVELFKRNEKIAKHIHLPLQSGSDKVLKEMQRGYDREAVLSKIHALQAAGVFVSTDIIVGYPTETEADFEETLSMVEEAKFSFAYCFKFSPRKGTIAYNIKNETSQKDIAKRLDILLNRIKHYAAKAYDDAAGKTEMVLMESPFKGRTGTNLWVKLKHQRPVGSMQKVYIEKSDGKILIGE